MNILRIACMFGGFLSLVLSLSAQTFTTVHSFDGTDGKQVFAGLVQAANGYFYGAAGAGGTEDAGTIFKITPSGQLTTLYSFCSQSGCPDGVASDAPLVPATNGDLYGTTLFGGASNACSGGCGVAF